MHQETVGARVHKLGSLGHGPALRGSRLECSI